MQKTLIDEFVTLHADSYYCTIMKGRNKDSPEVSAVLLEEAERCSRIPKRKIATSSIIIAPNITNMSFDMRSTVRCPSLPGSRLRSNC